MKKSMIVVFFGALQIILFCESGFTASFSYFNINHSIFEDGRNVYRISFNIIDVNQNVIKDYVLNSLYLIHEPSGDRITCDTRNIKFWTGNVFYGNYHIETGEFSYSEAVTSYTEYYGPVNGILANGECRLTANITTPLSGEQTIDITQQWNYNPVTLPTVSYQSFQTLNDHSGNFILEWDAPTGLNDSTNTRVSIAAFYQKTYVGEIYLRVPTDLGHITVPAEIIQQVEEWGDSYEIMVNIRTNDGTERTYSNSKILESLRINVAGDINNDAKIDLKEAIHALQIVSGSKQ
ncbi:hypothetical protein MHK_002224 [Candidatus Magnetomorum sp. HK-1]|nr:hypothetical protein MHK_002224 [Candidatus Magnetomorum sp. HK-1]